MNAYGQHANSVLALSWRKLALSKAKLKASSRTSALLSGFAMISMVELQINEDVPKPLLITFSVCASLLVAIHMLALMISTCILPHIEAVSNIHNATAVKESPHERMHVYIEMAWIFSTGLGILLFLIELIILCWVKFVVRNWDSAIAATVIITPIVIIFIIFSVHFYRTLIAHKYERSTQGLKELDKLADSLDHQNDVHVV
ncbi:protein orai-2-like [Tubulanus polymorphus]|uniref:protein orai-2-like n=1 Tax=Tubulanus polymorphus TaxID=672921 RepID=UPI003DA1DB42